MIYFEKKNLINLFADKNIFNHLLNERKFLFSRIPIN